MYTKLCYFPLKSEEKTVSFAHGTRTSEISDRFQFLILQYYNNTIYIKNFKVIAINLLSVPLFWILRVTFYMPVAVCVICSGYTCTRIESV